MDTYGEFVYGDKNLINLNLDYWIRDVRLPAFTFFLEYHLKLGILCK